MKTTSINEKTLPELKEKKTQNFSISFSPSVKEMMKGTLPKEETPSTRKMRREREEKAVKTSQKRGKGKGAMD